ncbi:C40 family peptidase [Moheibacter stercoris]|uniref:Cell wall-associated NlpC family hydrolase n=1 Tax=Moheibacter stercoris TaxID=1628251 RepID=A0ABV2LW45_9FLAO
MKFSTFCILFLGIIVLSSCHSTKRVTYKSSQANNRVTKVDNSKNSSLKKEVSTVLKEAKKFLGTPYKYGGTTKTGLDCSGLVFNSFDAIGVKMPRISREQANLGKEIRLREVKEGDLVFFNTSGSSISHVGIVETVKNGEIFFIHSSTSKGVIISSLEETYWNKRFVKATRIL